MSAKAQGVLFQSLSARWEGFSALHQVAPCIRVESWNTWKSGAADNRSDQKKRRKPIDLVQRSFLSPDTKKKYIYVLDWSASAVINSMTIAGKKSDLLFIQAVRVCFVPAIRELIVSPNRLRPASFYRSGGIFRVSMTSMCVKSRK